MISKSLIKGHKITATRTQTKQTKTFLNLGTNLNQNLNCYICTCFLHLEICSSVIHKLCALNPNNVFKIHIIYFCEKHRKKEIYIRSLKSYILKIKCNIKKYTNGRNLLSSKLVDLIVKNKNFYKKIVNSQF